MKQGTAKTFGVTVLGAAFAVAAAGSASAATGDVLEGASLGEVTKTLPAGASESVAVGQQALGHTLTATTAATAVTAASAAPAAQQGTAAAIAAQGDKAGQGRQGGLLGGLPLDQLPVGAGGGQFGIG
jgi:hypothetical protein